MSIFDQVKLRVLQQRDMGMRAAEDVAAASSPGLKAAVGVAWNRTKSVCDQVRQAIHKVVSPKQSKVVAMGMSVDDEQPDSVQAVSVVDAVRLSLRYDATRGVVNSRPDGCGDTVGVSASKSAVQLVGGVATGDMFEEVRRKAGKEVQSTWMAPVGTDTLPDQRMIKRMKLEPCSDYSSEEELSSGLDEKQEAELDELMQDTSPDSTLRTDRSHWKSWCEASARVGVSPWVIKKPKTAKARRKLRRQVVYTVWMVYRYMQPRSKKDPAAKPDSAYQVYLAARRVHRRAGYDMVGGELVVDGMKAMNKRFVKKYGFQPLIKKRKEPLTRKFIVKFLSMSYGMKVGHLVVSKTRGWKSWR